MNSHCRLDSKASMKWQNYFNNLQLGLNHYTIRCLFSEIIPGGTIILFNSYIIYHLTRTSRRLIETIGEKRAEERMRTTSWMNIVLILHSSFFLVSILSHIGGHFLAIEAHESWWVLLAILANCSLNFYVYCLSGEIFRQKINYCIQCLTTQILYKLQTPKQFWQHRLFSSSEEKNREWKDQYPKKTKQAPVDLPKTDQKPLHSNSSLLRIKELSEI